MTKFCIAALVTIIVSCLSLHAATYYVAPNGSSANQGTLASPWDVATANNVVDAGDTVMLLDGVYPLNTMINPANTGIVVKPIIFRTQNKHGAVFSSDNNATPPIKLDGKNHITFDGLKVRNSRRWFQIENASHITMMNCDMQNDIGIAQSYTIGRFYFCHYVHIVGCSFAGGSDLVKLNTGDNHLIEDNFFGDALHTSLVLLGVKHSRICKNTFRNRLWRSMEVETQRESPYRWSAFNVIEDNDFQFSFNGIQYAGNSSIIRRNVFRHSLTAFSFANYLGGVGDVPEAWYDANNRFYNNVIAECGYNSIVQDTIATNAANGYDVAESVDTSAVALDIKTNLFNPTVVTTINPQPKFEDNILLNNVFYKNANIDHAELGNVAYHLGWNTDASQAHAHHNIFYTGLNQVKVIRHDDESPSANRTGTLSFYEGRYPSQIHDNNEDDPGFTDAANGDFKLLAGSNGIDAGSFLTTARNGGTGTVIEVVDALYFSDGVGLITGDLIRIGVETATLIDVDYSTNTLTVDVPMTWVVGAAVSLDYSGMAPDIGAFERASLLPQRYRKLSIVMPSDQFSVEISPAGLASSKNTTFTFSQLRINNTHTVRINTAVNN